MPFNRPSLATLIDRIRSDIESGLPGTNARLRRNMLAILGRAEAGATHGLYGHLEWIARQVMPDTAETEWLERWANIWGLTRKAPVAATGSVTFSGTDGVTVPAGTVLTRSDGAEYVTAADATIADGAASASVTASTPGADGNTVAGSALSFVSPVAGVQSSATVGTAGLIGGTETETDDELRSRLLKRIQDPPKAGASSDYEEWALEVSGVTRAWVYPQELGAGTVTVRVVTDDAADGPIPDAATVQAVQDYIDSVRPVTATVTALAPIADPLDLTIELTPNTLTVREAVQAEIADLIAREAVPGGTLLRSHINEAISTAAGETDHKLIAPADDVVSGTGDMTVLGDITWQ